MYKKSTFNAENSTRFFFGCLQGQSTDSIPFAFMNASLLFQWSESKTIYTMGKTSVVLAFH